MRGLWVATLTAQLLAVVQYFITDLDPVSLRAFTVSPLTPLVDHSKIMVYVKRAQSNYGGPINCTPHTHEYDIYRRVINERKKLNAGALQ